MIRPSSLIRDDEDRLPQFQANANNIRKGKCDQRNALSASPALLLSTMVSYGESSYAEVDCSRFLRIFADDEM